MNVTNFVIQQRFWPHTSSARLNLTGTKATFDGTTLVCYFRSIPSKPEAKASLKEILSHQIHVNLELTIKRTDVLKILQSGQIYTLNAHGQVVSFKEINNQWAITIGVISVWKENNKN